MYLAIALVIGIAFGALSCLPEPVPDLRKSMLSVALGFFGALAGWSLGRAIGADDIGPAAQLFISTVGSMVTVSVFHAATSERSRLK